MQIKSIGGRELLVVPGDTLSGANLSWANLGGANLRGANLRGAKGLLDPSQWLHNLEQTPEGFVAYKMFGRTYPPPAKWQIEPGAYISEVVNPDRCTACACGVNVARKSWFSRGDTAWRVLIEWHDLAGCVVPYNTDGKFRVGRVKLLEEVQL